MTNTVSVDVQEASLTSLHNQGALINYGDLEPQGL